MLTAKHGRTGSDGQGSVGGRSQPKSAGRSSASPSLTTIPIRREVADLFREFCQSRNLKVGGALESLIQTGLKNPRNLLARTTSRKA